MKALPAPKVESKIQTTATGFVAPYGFICQTIDEYLNDIASEARRASEALKLRRQLIRDGRIVLSGVEYRLTKTLRLAAGT